MDTTTSRVVTLVSQVTGKSADELSCRLEEEGLWDSFNKVEIVFAIEDEFGVRLNADQVATLKTINDIIGFLTK